MATVRDRFDNLIDTKVYNSWCKIKKLKSASPAANKEWNKGVKEGQIYMMGSMLIDTTIPSAPVTFDTGVK